MKNWLKSKTLWTAVVAIVGTVGSVVQGVMTWQEAVPVITAALVGVFLRNSIVKKGVNQ